MYSGVSIYWVEFGFKDAVNPQFTMITINIAWSNIGLSTIFLTKDEKRVLMMLIRFRNSSNGQES
jgi:hypothetical protein